MTKLQTVSQGQAVDEGLLALCQIAGFYRIGADPSQLAHKLALQGRTAQSEDLVRAAKLLHLKARILHTPSEQRLKTVPTPALVKLKGGFVILGGRDADGKLRLLYLATRLPRALSYDELAAEWDGEVVLVTRRAGVGIDPRQFGFHWFLPSIWRYRRPLAHVLLASLFVQVFALVNPLFFQIVVDKVLVHKGTSTLVVIAIGMVSLGLFNVVLQYLRAYVLSHTTNRIDVELGARLFNHLLHLPLSYFETRAAGQTVARVRELETIRAFLTGQGLSSLIDLLFTVVFIAVLFAYSWFLALIVLCSAPLYSIIAILIRPILREKINQKIQPRCGNAAVSGRSRRRHADAQGRRRRAYDAGKLGGEARGLCEDLVRRDVARDLRAERDPICVHVHNGAHHLFRRAGCDRRTDDRRRAGRVQHDRQSGGAADIAAVAAVPGFPAGSCLGRASRRHPQCVPWKPVPQNLPRLPPPRGAIELKNISFRYRPGYPEVLSDVSLVDRRPVRWLESSAPRARANRR